MCNYLLARNSWLPVFIRNRCFWFFRLSEEAVRAKNREIDSPKKFRLGDVGQNDSKLSQK